MQQLTYEPDVNDLDIMRDLRRQKLRLIRLIPGRGTPGSGDVRKTIVYVIEEQE